MKRGDVIANNCLHWLTEEQIIAKMVELGIDPNDEVNEGEKVQFGNLAFIAYDMGDSGRKLLSTARDATAQVVCPTCNGKGVVDEPTNS